MKIETKFNIGDIVFTMFKDKIEKTKVDAIYTRIDTRNNLIIEYGLVSVPTRKEKDIFKTKEELIATL